MYATTLKNLAAHKLRLLATTLAVLLGVAFMAGTLVLTDTLNATFDGLVADANAGTDAVVRGRKAFGDAMLGDQRPRLDASLVDAVRRVDGVAVAEGSIQAYARIVDKAGKPVGNPDQGAPTRGADWIADPALNPFRLAEGRPPAGDREVVIDKASAEGAGFVVGDAVTVLTQAGPQTVTVVGLARFGEQDSPGGASYVFFTPAAAQALLTQPGEVDAVKVLAAEGVSAAEVVERISRVIPAGTEVLTGEQITAEDQTTMKASMQFMNTFLLVFALIALFVGSFIIYNSFSILVAQRSREMALLRAIGATRRQVLGSVLVEAVVVGLTASLAGLVSGIGVASGLKALMGTMGIEIPAGTVTVSPRTAVVALATGLAVSVAAAVLPARRAARVAPVAAMGAVPGEATESRRVRLAAGLGLVGAGAAAVVAGLFAAAGIPVTGAGVALVFVGVAVLGPVGARPLSRVLGAPLPRLAGMPGTLARENAMRNPRRTSATAAALMIGVALVGFITILASSAKASIDTTLDSSFSGDVVVTSGSFSGGGFSPQLAERLRALPELDAVTGMRLTAVEVAGSGHMLTSADPGAVQAIGDLDVRSGSLAGLGADGLAVSTDVARERGWSVGDVVPVHFGQTGVRPLTLEATYADRGMVGDWFVGLPAYEANVADQYDVQVFARYAPGVDPAQARAAVDRVAGTEPLAKVQDRTEFKAAKGAQVDMMLNLIYVLLALAVLIALLGIANTLALSIFERTRELGLLRAVGMTRGQLRSTIRGESVVIALLGTTVGLAVGACFGWVMVRALADKGLGTFHLPAGQLAVVTAIAAAAGVGAALLPARRAARMDVLRAVMGD